MQGTGAASVGPGRQGGPPPWSWHCLAGGVAAVVLFGPHGAMRVPKFGKRPPHSLPAYAPDLFCLRSERARGKGRGEGGKQGPPPKKEGLGVEVQGCGTAVTGVVVSGPRLPSSCPLSPGIAFQMPNPPKGTSGSISPHPAPRFPQAVSPSCPTHSLPCYMPAGTLEEK